MANVPIRLIADETLTRRALAAYFRSDDCTQQPSASMSGAAFHKDKAYIVLRNNYDTLAVYRVRNDGILKRLRRWPAAVENA